MFYGIMIVKYDETNYYLLKCNGIGTLFDILVQFAYHP
jgi:hypothetical protein